MLSELLMIVVGGLKMGAIYSLTAIGIVVIHKATRTVNFAHGAFVLCGAYVTYGIVEVLQFGWWAAFLLASLAGGLLATVVELGILRPIRQADSFAVITRDDLHRYRHLRYLQTPPEHRDPCRSQHDPRRPVVHWRCDDYARTDRSGQRRNGRRAHRCRLIRICEVRPAA